MYGTYLICNGDGGLNWTMKSVRCYMCKMMSVPYTYDVPKPQEKLVLEQQAMLANEDIVEPDHRIRVYVLEATHCSGSNFLVRLWSAKVVCTLMNYSMMVMVQVQHR